ncbi:MAG: asparaginase [Pseudomonadota bacterium]
MSETCLIEVTRGSLVESGHAGCLAVVDADGVTVLALGDVDRPVFPRSAVKALQAVPLVESGAADALGLGNAALALACSSHNSEVRHVETALAMLASAGRDGNVLECGAHWPKRLADQKALIRAGREPDATYNNCSGKHAGFVCLSHHLGVDPAGYIKPEHAVQQAVRADLETFTGRAFEADSCGIDGCSIPTYAVPLTALARAFATFGTGNGLAPAKAAAAARLRSACAAEPFQVAGTGRFCTEIMQHFGKRVFVKTGAEGVFCAAFPENGLGIALKCGDGATRAAEAMMAHVIKAFLPLSTTDEAFLASYLTVAVHNWNGLEVGSVRASQAFRDALAGRQ